MRTLKLPCVIALLTFSTSLFAQEENPADLQAILQELSALRAQVAGLEERLAELEEKQDTVAEAVLQEEGKSKEKRKWFDTMRVELQKAEVRASGAWTEAETWEQISVGMEVEQVIAILGEPTYRKFSVRKDTDEILHYEGDLLGDGDLIEGEIRIYKGKIRRFTAPDFPESDS